jgi:hypothetical protein
MPKDAFAIIRKYTAGRSAVQSRSFRRVEQSAASGPDGGWDRPTMQEEFLLAGRRLPAEAVERVRAAMVRLDESWRAMKRSHWGITLKTIGRVPGTGGTAGADYLHRSSRLPLFPTLAPA